MINFRHVEIGPHFDKVYIEGPWEGPSRELNWLTAPDFGPPHDHALTVRSHVSVGSYVEEVFHRDGSSHTVVREEGDTFTIPADRLHRIIALPSGASLTIITPLSPIIRVWGFVEWRDGVAWKRNHDEPDFHRVEFW